uniref:Uncharacterized protein n=1 Tax=Chromera velia CCMP2878 TaxID=1169474 RepID=A0A0G4FRI3_9ALVE|eukprot:Cvel_18299.t1-p1 / transcript=Cvel_18299.t1 / gene=Cvel_18299 / organism=Chromera_velia_CCMP2878 / gene_product=hypothetical protein / transcript_product=hypothetical protein / location=Cvel_scaffold1509:1794-2384(-) / protein_length=197 / sequence_SO=supercontig / SO=protein_coding / is_pseudo=false
MSDCPSLLVHVLKYEDGAHVFFRMLSSVPSVVLQLICKASRQATVENYRDRGLNPSLSAGALVRTKIVAEIIPGAPNVNLCHWLLDLPSPPRPEIVLRACALANAEETLTQLCASHPLCGTASLRNEGRFWLDEEVHSASNLLAICDGAIEGGHTVLLRSALERLVPPLLDRHEGPAMSAMNRDVWIDWLKAALKRR